MKALVIAAVVGVALGLLVWWRRRRRGPRRTGGNREEALRRKWRRLSAMPPAQADAALSRTLAMLEEKHPGRTRGWYLAKAVQDLERSKR